MTRIARPAAILSIAATAAVLTFVGISPANSANLGVHSDASDFAFDSFNAEYYLSRDSDGLAKVKVVETLVADFPTFDQNHGILRDIPRYINDNPLNINLISVTDGDRKPVQFVKSDVTSDDGTDTKFTELKLGSADTFVHGKTTYVITYELHNVVTNYTDTKDDELYLDVNGTGWQQQFGSVRAVIHIAPALIPAENNLTSCFHGPYGSRDTCDLSRNADGSVFATTVDNLGPYSTVTFDIGFKDHTFAQPALAKNSWVVTIAPWAIALFSLLLVLVALIVRIFLWRDARGKGIVIPQYSAPDDQDLLIAGDIVHREKTALAAQFVDLAVRGFVNVVDLKPSTTGASSPSQFALEYVKKQGATAQEQRVISSLFDNSPSAGDQAKLDSLSASKGADLFAMRAKARQSSLTQKLRAEPPGKINSYIRRLVWLVIAAFVAIYVWTVVVDVDASGVIFWAIVSIITCIVASGLLSKPEVLTAEGADRRDYLLGIRDYLQLAEEDRLRVLQSPQGAERINVTDKHAIVKLNELLLPFAVLFGVEKEWSKVLEVQYAAIAENPSWLSSNLSSMNFGYFVSQFSTASVSSVRPLVATSSGSSWSSSGGSSFSSGFSGGGFSGGGGGGGGGGGW